MTVSDYFSSLEALSKKVSEAVRISCGNEQMTDVKQRLDEIAKSTGEDVYKIEKALFCEFATPIQREHIAALAHSFLRVIIRCVEHEASLKGKKRSDEERLYVQLADELCDGVKMLKSIRTPDTEPRIEEFRATFIEASEAHSALLERIRAGMLPSSLATAAFSCSRIRYELSRGFDELVEIMLASV